MKILSEKGFAAGDPEFLGAQRDEDSGESGDLFVGEDEGFWEEDVIWAEDLAGHAIGAAQVATVGDGDPQVAELSSEEVSRCVVHGG